MAKKKQDRLEFRYYEIPTGNYVLALQGERWVRPYGKGQIYQHFHNYMEVGFCYYGEGALTLNGRDYAYSGNMFSVIPANYPHNTVSRDESFSSWAYLFIDSDRFIRDIYADKPRMAEEVIKIVNRTSCLMACAEKPTLSNVIQGLLYETRQQEPFFKEKIKGLLTVFFVELARLEPGATKTTGGGLEWGMQTQIGNALHYIGKHYGEQIRMETLAEKCNLSETHFRRVFHSVMGKSPLEYLNYVRIRMACNLMETTDSSIADIAMQAGFISVSTFNRNFKRVMHITPNAWRRRTESYQNLLRNYYVSVEKGWE